MNTSEEKNKPGSETSVGFLGLVLFLRDDYLPLFTWKSVSSLHSVGHGVRLRDSDSANSRVTPLSFMSPLCRLPSG